MILQHKLKIKLYRNVLAMEKLHKLDKFEKQEVILELCKTRTERKLSKEIGIPHSTIHDWKTLRQDNTGMNIHLSLPNIARKLKVYKPKTKMDLEILKNILKFVKNILDRYQ